MEDLPEDILRRINDLVPHDEPPYMSDLTEAMTIATETGVTILERRRQERAMRRAYEMARAALYGGQTVMTDTPPMVNPAAGYNDVTSLYPYGHA